jgi:hypothetical protein
MYLKGGFVDFIVIKGLRTTRELTGKSKIENIEKSVSNTSAKKEMSGSLTVV